MASKKLPAIPLFEGEELLEEINFSHNEISRIENLISLHRLAVLNLSYNSISLIANLSTLQSLKVLNLSHNRIGSMKGLEYLKSLEVLDLEDNLITGVAGLSNLSRLCTLALNENKVRTLEGIEVLGMLRELSVKKNMLTSIEKVQMLDKLEVLDASYNSIESISKECMEKLETLRQFTYEQNPCYIEPGIDRAFEEIEVETKQIPSPFKNLANALNYAKAVEKDDVPVIAKKIEHSPKVVDIVEYSPKQVDIIERIRTEWKAEESNPASTEIPKLCLPVLENRTTLHLYGAAALDSLTTTGYENSITDIIFECIKFEHIVYPPVMLELKKYGQLSSISLIMNGLTSFVLLSKLEGLDKIKKLTIKQNKICNLVTLNAFIAYRFQHVSEINGKAVSEQDRKIAKREFEKFDKSLASATLANKKHLSYKKICSNKAAVKAASKEFEQAAYRLYQKKLKVEAEAISAKKGCLKKYGEEYIKDFVYDYLEKMESEDGLEEELNKMIIRKGAGEFK